MYKLVRHNSCTRCHHTNGIFSELFSCPLKYHTLVFKTISCQTVTLTIVDSFYTTVYKRLVWETHSSVIFHVSFPSLLTPIIAFSLLQSQSEFSPPFHNSQFQFPFIARLVVKFNDS